MQFNALTLPTLEALGLKRAGHKFGSLVLGRTAQLKQLCTVIPKVGQTLYPHLIPLCIENTYPAERDTRRRFSF